MKNNKKNASKKNKSIKAKKAEKKAIAVAKKVAYENEFSMRGKKGSVGAPKKSVKWPDSAFTMEKLFVANKKVCEPSVRSRVKDGLADGSIIELVAQKNREGVRGRPKAKYVLAENYNAETMVKKSDAPIAETETETVGEMVAAAEPTVITGEVNQTPENVTETVAETVIDAAAAEPVQEIQPEIVATVPEIITAPTMAEATPSSEHPLEAAIG